MLRVLYILLWVYLALLSNSTQGSRQGEEHTMPHSEVVAENHTQQLICQRECNSDMLHTPRTALTITSQSRIASNQQVRHRGDEQLKFYASALPARRAGHITRIFEFNCFRSVLRVRYYLYALCRLRI